ncbi:hypothetical protein U1Q18_018428 [Sarracenia purpurea var. burkii]
MRREDHHSLLLFSLRPLSLSKFVSISDQRRERRGATTPNSFRLRDSISLPVLFNHLGIRSSESHSRELSSEDFGKRALNLDMLILKK